MDVYDADIRVETTSRIEVCVFYLQSAVGHEYQSKLSKHCSQTDTSKGFGGKFGVEADRVDQVSPQISSGPVSVSVLVFTLSDVVCSCSLPWASSMLERQKNTPRRKVLLSPCL